MRQASSTSPARPDDLWDFLKEGPYRQRAVIGGAGTPFPLRTIVPLVEVVPRTEQDGPSLIWREGRGSLSEALDQSLWEFVELGEASEEAILRYVQRQGVLTGTAPAVDDTPPELRGWDLIAGTEPFEAWRAIAQGFGAVLDLATAVAISDPANSPHATPHREQLVRALHAIATTKWLTNRDGTVAMPTLGDTHSQILVAALDVELSLPDSVQPGLRWVMGLLLACTGIQSEPDVVGDTGDEAHYSIPAAIPGLLEHPPRTKRKHQARADFYWRVPGLLPALTLALARAVEPGEYARCAYCARLAHVVKNRPDQRRGWFGDHEYCRSRSRAQAMREAAKRYRARRTAAQEADA